MPGIYLALLIISIAGISAFDYRYKLAIFNKPRQTLSVLGISVLIFLIWDILGIKLGIFFIGDTKLLTGLAVGELPLEEIFFLILLNYCALSLYLFFKRNIK